MIEKIEMKDAGLEEQTLINQGNIHLSGITLRDKIFDKTIYGDYFIGRIYVLYIDNEGNMEGENDLGSHHFGKCFIDFEKNTLTTEWTNGWDNWTGRAYEIDDEIKFFDTTTGEWRTTFKKTQNGSSPIEISN